MEEKFEECNFDALVLLLALFREMSGDPVVDEAEFRREIHIRWKLWREMEGWNLDCPAIGGYFELHLRKDVLGVRVFKRIGDAEPKCVVRLRILLNGAGLTNSSFEFADDGDGKLVAARLLELISYNYVLHPLERSLARGLSKYVTSDSLALAEPFHLISEPKRSQRKD